MLRYFVITNSTKHRPGSDLTEAVVATVLVASPLPLTPRNPLIPLRIMAPGDSGAAPGNPAAAEMTAGPLTVGAMASPGERGAPAKNEETG